MLLLSQVWSRSGLPSVACPASWKQLGLGKKAGCTKVKNPDLQLSLPGPKTVTLSSLWASVSSSLKRVPQNGSATEIQNSETG